MVRQRTLKQAIRASGIGLHSGRKVYMSLLPAGQDTGIVFRRTDLEPAVEVAGSAHLLREAEMCRPRVNDADVKNMTIAHMMSVLAGLGMENCVVYVDDARVPT